MTLRHYALSRQNWTQFSEDVYAFVLWRYVAVQIWRVKELFVPGIVASTIKFHVLTAFEFRHCLHDAIVDVRTRLSLVSWSWYCSKQRRGTSQHVMIATYILNTKRLAPPEHGV